jgi:hypothetical protein
MRSIVCDFKQKMMPTLWACASFDCAYFDRAVHEFRTCVPKQKAVGCAKKLYLELRKRAACCQFVVCILIVCSPIRKDILAEYLFYDTLSLSLRSSITDLPNVAFTTYRFMCFRLEDGFRFLSNTILGGDGSLGKVPLQVFLLSDN